MTKLTRVALKFAKSLDVKVRRVLLATLLTGCAAGVRGRHVADDLAAKEPEA
jgi:hypothetical protein